MKRYELYSALPPEELKKRLAWEIAVENEQYKKQFRIVLRWTGEYGFTFRTEEYTRDCGAYSSARVGTRGASLGFGFGAGRSMGYSPVFCGQIAPHGDGSVISGHFRQVALGWIVGGVMAACIVAAGAVWGRTDVALVAAALCVPVLRMLLRPDRTGAAGELWDVLENILASIETGRSNEIEEE